MLVGMVAILGLIAGGLVSLLGVIGALMTLPDLYRVWRVLSVKRVSIDQLQEGPATIAGLVTVDSRAFPAVGDGRMVVYSKLTVFEQVGTNNLQRLHATQSVDFVVDDGSGTLVVSPDGARVMSPELLAGRANEALLELGVGRFAWPNTPKTYTEEVLCPGEFVTISGVVDDLGQGRFLEQAWIFRGEPTLRSSEEARAFAFGLLAVPGGAVIAGVSWLLLEWFV